MKLKKKKKGNQSQQSTQSKPSATTKLLKSLDSMASDRRSLANNYRKNNPSVANEPRAPYVSDRMRDEVHADLQIMDNEKKIKKMAANSKK